MEGEYTMKSWQFKVIQALGIVSLILLCKGLDATQWAVFIIVVLAIMCASYGDGLRERAKIYEDIFNGIKDAQEELRKEILEGGKDESHSN